MQHKCQYMNLAQAADFTTNSTKFYSLICRVAADKCTTEVDTHQTTLQYFWHVIAIPNKQSSLNDHNRSRAGQKVVWVEQSAEQESEKTSGVHTKKCLCENKTVQQTNSYFN